MQLLKLLRTADRTIRARFHYWLGRLFLIWGRKESAERQFREVLSQLGEDFQASLCLGRLALEAGDLPGALREMSAARRHSPARFARLRAEIWQALPESGDTDGTRLSSTRGERRFFQKRDLSDLPAQQDGRGSERPEPGPGRRTRSGLAAWGGSGPEGIDREMQGSQPLPQFYYWQQTPESFDFDMDQGKTPQVGAWDKTAEDRSAGDWDEAGLFSVTGSSSSSSGGSSSEGESAGDGLDGGDAASGSGDTDSWFFGDSFLRDERSEDSPWTDFLSHHYFFDSLPQDLSFGENDESLEEDEFDSLGDDPFDFLSDEETEALSPWSEQISAEDLKGEPTQDFSSPLAGFYEELEEARRQADGGATEPAEPSAAGSGEPAESPDWGTMNQDPLDRNPGGPGFSDHERFKGLPPIQPSDLGSVDWEELFGRLANED